jgi:bifunctional polynucleotide phosphatase/kinase
MKPPILPPNEIFHIGGSPRFRKKVAAFDFDWTIARPVKDLIHSSSSDDIRWMHDTIPDVLRAFYKKGYAVTVVTNQRNRFKKTAIVNLVEKLDIPVTVSIGWSLKKPDASLFPFDTNRVDLSKSFYVGDAAGRPGDWAAVDKQFAIAVGIQFKTPEEMFPALNIKTLKEIVIPPPLYNTQVQAVILVGYPGSGKSTYAKDVLVPNGFIHIEGDVLKTPAKMIASAKKNLQDGVSVVFDATNPTIERRSTFVAAAKNAGAESVSCVHVTTSMVESMRRNRARGKAVPDVVFYTFRKRFEAIGAECDSHVEI